MGIRKEVCGARNRYCDVRNKGYEVDGSSGVGGWRLRATYTCREGLVDPVWPERVIVGIPAHQGYA